jgi:peptidoglycan/xylan/chitin deacetylase (PgdA/CDA1 family)
MFHHFHDNQLHKQGQGSISKDDFYELIKFIGHENILGAEEFFNRFKENKLKPKEVCFTFDDGIRCQYDVALPVLEDLNIKSFFFVYSSLLKKNPDMLEVYRYFRMNFFNDVDDFYNRFFKNLDKDLNLFFKDKDKIIDKSKVKYPYYSINDIKFRLIRDKFLTGEEYKTTMFRMFDEKNFNHKKCYEILFLNSEHLKKIKELGHLIGLHSHTHPMLLENLSYNEQLNQYQNNISTLSEVLKINKTDIKYMAHPRGSYNKDTLKMLKDLGIEIGFKDSMTIDGEKNMKKINNSFLEIARQDHATIIKMMNK